MPILYGIPNCNTVKKARQWLTENNIHYVFHDFKKLGIDLIHLNDWTKQVGLDVVINRQGNTWRHLDEQEKRSIETEASAFELVQNHTSLIKRPVLEYQGRVWFGFSDELYAEIFDR